MLLLGVWILELRESGWPDVWLAAACLIDRLHGL
eukprot:SAG25_NODE_2291_length_1749_cov_2.710909_1_plen_33_part_10